MCTAGKLVSFTDPLAFERQYDLLTSPGQIEVEIHGRDERLVAAENNISIY